MIFKGFKFGMLLQLAVGPVCIYIFQISSIRGFYAGETGVFGAALIDCLFIVAAIFGIASIIEKKNVKSALKIFGAVILFVFGISMILGQFNINLIPSLSLGGIQNSNNAFLSTAVLTASNPLTIIFWAGVFSAKIAENDMKRKEMYIFGFGALLSTLFFLTLVSAAGTLVKTFLSNEMVFILNIAVGLMLIYFSIKMIRK